MAGFLYVLIDSKYTRIIIVERHQPSIMKKVLIAALVLTAIAAPAQSATIVGNNNAASLVSNLLGSDSGITVVGTPTFTGNASQGGTFSSGNIGSGLGLDSGIVLSTGMVGDINTVPYTINADGTLFGTAGDNNLNTLIPGGTTVDATTLAFNFTTNTNSVYFLNYVFASQEYRQFVGSQYNDVFGFFIDGVNIAKVPGTNQPVSINTINDGGNGLPAGGINPNLFINNTNNARTLEFGGLTVPLTASVLNLSPGVHSFKLAIADVGDAGLDSAVFLASNGISSTPVYGGSVVPPTSVPEPLSIVGTLIGGAAALKFRSRFKANNKI
jgi:hypothetical protein